MIQFSAERCRQEAELCCRRAERPADGDPAVWLELADRWNEMADRAEMLFSGMPETAPPKQGHRAQPS
jgi:hypothetical protein